MFALVVIESKCDPHCSDKLWSGIKLMMLLAATIFNRQLFLHCCSYVLSNIVQPPVLVHQMTHFNLAYQSLLFCHYSIIWMLINLWVLMVYVSARFLTTPLPLLLPYSPKFLQLLYFHEFREKIPVRENIIENMLFPYILNCDDLPSS